MFEVLAWAGMNYANILQQLEDLGFFSHVLPFILIFAIIYAILSKIEMFKDNKGASVLIAFAVGLLSLQLNFVSVFFKNVFPKVGIGITLVFIAMILSGVFLLQSEQGKKAYPWIFFGIGAFIFIVITILSFSGDMFNGSWWWEQYGALTIVMLLIVTAIIVIVTTGKD